MPNFDTLHEHVKNLDALLDDRQEGLATWSLMVGNQWLAIAQMWNAEDAESCE